MRNIFITKNSIPAYGMKNNGKKYSHKRFEKRYYKNRVIISYFYPGLLMDPVDFIRLKLSKLFRGKVDRKISLPIGVFAKGEVLCLLLQNRVTPGIIDVAQSDDDFSFSLNEHSLKLEKQHSNTFLGNVSSFISKGKTYFITKNRKGVSLGTLKGTTLSLQPVSGVKEKCTVASSFECSKGKVMYFGNRAIYIAYSQDLISWKSQAKPLIIGSHPLEVGSVFETDHGLLLLYFKKEIEDGCLYHSAFLALFDKANPEKVLWKTEAPVWKQKEHWTKTHIHHLGTLMHRSRLASYWYVEGRGIYGVLLTGFKFDPESFGPKKVMLDKHDNNPIIAPNPDNKWEAFNTFNPAAVYAGNKVHILYRAQGFDYVSTVGYAASSDGITIDERCDKPVFKPHEGFEINKKNAARHDFMSGGGFGGCEDPRITVLDDRVYMTYVAFDGWTPPRLALTSIKLRDFLDHRWNWEKPVLISPPGIIDKSGCVFPEKVNGKYVFFHRVFPNILIDYVDDLNFDGKNKWLKGQYQIKIRDNMWDSRKIGAGAPPIKTKDGWLLIYYGVDDRDASKYHIGAMLLDLNDPAHVLHRCKEPILSPTDDYENNGFKPGIAYPCGAVILKDELLVYYGGSDSVVCVATAKLDTFLEELKTKETAHLSHVQVREVDY